MQKLASLFGCFATLVITLPACQLAPPDDEGRSAAPVEGAADDDDDCDDDGADACEGLEGLGSYEGFFCAYDGPFILTESISCQDALDNCALNASVNPTESVLCTWNDVVIFTNEVTPGACEDVGGDPEPPTSTCDGLQGVGSYEGFFCTYDGPFILTETISCQDALDNCALNASANPTESVLCT